MQMTTEIHQAVTILRAGGLVAFPTETVYGLGADATNEVAIRKIFAAKERPFDHPLIVHLSHIDQLTDWAINIPPAALQLAQVCWPGPLTMILRKQPQVSTSLTGGQDTIGLRIPNHPVALALLKAFGGGIAAPSANKFTHISPTTVLAVQEELGNKVNLILDGGACAVGLESTIIDMTATIPAILRPGMITSDTIATLLNTPITTISSQRAPGMHHLHYAPQTKTLLMPTEKLAAFVETAAPTYFPMACVGYSDVVLPTAANLQMIKLANHSAQYAHDIYHTLRQLDQQQFKCILVEDVPSNAAWDAIRDRLTKASRR
jgi:L-threonylcarbamoyladenylate synthase